MYDHEIGDIVNRLRNQSNIERRLLEQPEPIKHFEPGQKDSKSSDEPLFEESRPCNSSEIDDDEPG